MRLFSLTRLMKSRFICNQVRIFSTHFIGEEKLNSTERFKDQKKFELLEAEMVDLAIHGYEDKAVQLLEKFEEHDQNNVVDSVAKTLYERGFEGIAESFYRLARNWMEYK